MEYYELEVTYYAGDTERKDSGYICADSFESASKYVIETYKEELLGFTLSFCGEGQFLILNYDKPMTI